jgi:hypothetical protein
MPQNKLLEEVFNDLARTVVLGLPCNSGAHQLYAVGGL